MDEIGILIALRGESEEFLLGAIERRHDLVITRRCVDAAEVLAAGLAGLGTIAIIDDALGVDHGLVTRLARAGVRTALVTDAPVRAEAIGAHPLIGEGEALIREIELLADLIRTGDTAPGDLGPVIEPGTVVAGSREGRGRIIMITGPSGAPGRTCVAVNLAAELVADGQDVLLIDADVWGASIAPTLALTDTTAGLAAAVRAAVRGTLDAPGFERLCLPVTSGLRVLAGVSRASRWREIPGTSLPAVWDMARAAAGTVLLDAPTVVPGEDGDGFDRLGPDRNAVVDSAVDAADEVVVVGAGEPIGIERLVAFLLDLRDRYPSLDPTVVVNRVRASAAGARPEESVREALARFAGVDDPVLITDDRIAFDRALLSGGVLAEIAPKSVARRGLRELARRLGDAEEAEGRPRGRRRAERRPRTRSSRPERGAPRVAE